MIINDRMIIKKLGDTSSHPDMDAREAPAPAVVADLSDDEAGPFCPCESQVLKVVLNKLKNGTWITSGNLAKL